MQGEAIVDNLLLTPTPSGDAGAIVVGSPAWFAWLGEATRFRLATPQGLITVRKERSGGGRGGWYWRAYRKQRGRLHRFYLGPDSALTPQALAAASAALGTLPAEAPEDGAPPPVAVPDREPDGSGGERLPLILRTKLTPPVLRPGLVARPALVTQLRAAAAHSLTLLIAPAGFGKTTLLAQALAGIENRELRIEKAEQAATHALFSMLHSQFNVAWLTLDQGDDAPGDFLVALCAALARVVPDLVGPTGALLRSPYRGDPAHVLDQLLGDLTGCSGSLCVVLDDYHVLEDGAVHQLVTRLVEHAPPAVHLVIASRTEPPLPLARLRARGLLAELRDRALRFEEAAAAELVERAGLQAVFAGEAGTLQRWLKALPADEVRARPFLHLAAAGHFPRLRHPQSVAEELAIAEDGLMRVGRNSATGGPHQAMLQAEALAVRAYVAQANGDLELAATLLLEALALLPEAERGLRWRLLVSLGNAYALEGWLAAAQVVLTASLTQAGDEPVLAYLSQSYRAWVDLSMGWVRRAETAFRALGASAEAAGWAELPLMGDALVGLGATLAERGQLREGLALLEHGLALMRRMGFNALLIPGELERARMCRALGRVAEAQAAVAAAAELARDFAAPFLQARIAAVRLDLGLDPAGDPPTAHVSVRYAEVPGRLAWARAAIRTGRSRQALAVLAPLLDVAERRRWAWALLPARILWALACAAEQNATGMREAISAAVAQSEPEGALLAFLEEGPEVVALLQRVAAMDRVEATGSRAALAGFLGALLAALHQGPPPGGGMVGAGGGPEALTPREWEVLALIAAGASNAEIAAQLVVTVGTVKAHSRSLFGKLGVANRTQAARAYHLGLLREH